MIQARYPGTCSACDDHIEVDEWIKSTRDEKFWVHIECPEVAALRPRAAVCEDCWLEKPCACD